MIVSVISVPVAMMAALCFYMGFTYLWLSVKSGTDKKSLIFSLLCITIALYDIFCAGLYSAENLKQGMFWQRLQLLTIPLIAAAFSAYVFIRIKKSSRKVFIFLIGYFILIFLIGLVTGERFSLTSDYPMIREINLFGFIYAIYYEAGPGPLTVLQNISLVPSFGYLLFVLTKEYLAGSPRIRLVVFSVSIFFLATLNDMLVGMAIYSFIYLAEYAFLLILLSMSYDFMTEFVETNVKLTQLNVSLDKKVEARTAQLDALMRELSETNKKLTILSTVDGLTGVKNRRYFDDRLQNEWRRSKREKRVTQEEKLPLSLLLMDLDHFKRINDKYGHPTGDECLITIAALLNEIVKRPGDVVARYGGEEFAVVLPATNAAGAAIIAEKIRAAVENIDFDYQGHTYKVTVSIGVVTFHPAEALSSEIMLASVDSALYKAKENGRNQVCVYKSES